MENLLQIILKNQAHFLERQTTLMEAVETLQETVEDMMYRLDPERRGDTLNYHESAIGMVAESDDDE